MADGHGPLDLGEGNQATLAWYPDMVAESPPPGFWLVVIQGLPGGFTLEMVANLVDDFLGGGATDFRL